MKYRAVGNRCAACLGSLELPLKPEKIIEILNQRGFQVVEVDLVALARECVGQSKYRRGARLFEAPEIFDCSSLMKWLYGKRGIWIPRRSIQQRELGEVIDYEQVGQGDLVFTSGHINYYHENRADGVGHVGIATGEGTVIHAANRRVGVIESPFDQFVELGSFRGARRYVPSGADVITLETPTDREVEVSDDIRWIILQSLPR